jgi:hypothetical protein
MRLFVILALIFLASCSSSPSRAPSSIPQLKGCHRYVSELLSEVIHSESTAQIVKKLRHSYTPYKNNNETFGIEFEGIAPKELSFNSMAQKLEQQLKDVHGEKVVEDFMVNKNLPKSGAISYKVNGQLNKMIIKSEMFATPVNLKAIEISSPVLSHDELTPFFNFLNKAASKNDLEAYPLGAGIHLHYGVPDLRYEEIRILYHLYFEIYEQLKRVFNIIEDERGVSRLPSSLLYQLERSNKTGPIDKFPTGITNKELLSYTYQEFGTTLEFRFANSSLNPYVLEYFVELNRRILKAIREKDKNFLDYLESSKRIPQLTEINKILELDNKFSLKKIISITEQEKQKARPPTYGWDNDSEVPILEFDD